MGIILFILSLLMWLGLIIASGGESLNDPKYGFGYPILLIFMSIITSLMCKIISILKNADEEEQKIHNDKEILYKNGKYHVGEKAFHYRRNAKKALIEKKSKEKAAYYKDLVEKKNKERAARYQN